MSVLPLSCFILDMLGFFVCLFLFCFCCFLLLYFFSCHLLSILGFNTNTSLFLLFYPCALPPCGVSFWASFSFPLLANVCISFFLWTLTFSRCSRFYLLLPACSHPFLTPFLDRPGHAHTPAWLHIYMYTHVNTCAHMHTYAHMHLPDATAWPCSLTMESLTVASGAAVAIFDSSLFLGGDVQVGRKSEGKPELAFCLQLRDILGRRLDFEEPGKGPREAWASEARLGIGQA